MINLLCFCIKSCNPTIKLIDLYSEFHFANKNQVIESIVNLVNASMPKSDTKEEDLPTEQKKKE